jgi:hypothetical protein
MILKSYTPIQASYNKSKFTYAENRRFDAFMYLILFLLVMLLAVYTSL